MELHLLAPRLQPAVTEPVWVTDAVDQAASLLPGARILAAHGPCTRNLPNAARNYAVARRLLREQEFERVVSTGSGIAVPFLLAAQRRGIEAHYIESAARVDSPSLSGRILERLARRVHLHTQHPGWKRPAWSFEGSVLDGFQGVRSGGPRRALRVLVVLGTAHFPFPALVLRLSELLHAHDDVIWQLGSTTVAAPLPGTVRAMLPSEEIQRAMRACDVLVAHAGVGTALSALIAGKRPLLVPRRVRRGEAMDDHQIATGRYLEDCGLAFCRELDELRRSDLEEAAAWRTGARDHAPQMPLGPTRRSGAARQPGRRRGARHGGTVAAHEADQSLSP